MTAPNMSFIQRFSLLTELFALFTFSSGESDELLASIDDMLADLNTELDFMIPGTDV